MARSRVPAASAGVVSLLFGALLFVPVIVLGAAIGWPASLDEPATVIMPLILDQQVAVQFGYLVYLAYSVLFFPAIALIGRVIGDSPTTRLSTVFAAISTVARSIGIIRWLTVLPALAVAYAAEPTAAIAIAFDAINSYGGGIGELLGVSAFGALAIALTSVSIARSGTLPKWLAAFGFVAAIALMLPWLELLGIDLGAILSISVTVVQLWFFAMGFALMSLARRDRVARLAETDSPAQQTAPQNDTVQKNTVQQNTAQQNTAQLDKTAAMES